MLPFLLGTNMPISSVTSEALQLKLRQLLPSQQGFGTDLSASDTIIPIIDLTQAAEGSDVAESLQTAIAFGSQTAFNATNSTVVIANTVGFWRITGAMTIYTTNSAAICTLRGSDGVSNKTYYEWVANASSTTPVFTTETFDFTVFLGTGERIEAVTNFTRAYLVGSARQVADANGKLIQPSGFTPQ